MYLGFPRLPSIFPFTMCFSEAFRLLYHSLACGAIINYCLAMPNKAQKKPIKVTAVTYLSLLTTATSEGPVLINGDVTSHDVPSSFTLTTSPRGCCQRSQTLQSPQGDAGDRLVASGVGDREVWEPWGCAYRLSHPQLTREPIFSAFRQWKALKVTPVADLSPVASVTERSESLGVAPIVFPTHNLLQTQLSALSDKGNSSR